MSYRLKLPFLDRGVEVEYSQEHEFGDSFCLWNQLFNISLPLLFFSHEFVRLSFKNFILK